MEIQDTEISRVVIPVLRTKPKIEEPKKRRLRVKSEKTLEK